MKSSKIYVVQIIIDIAVCLLGVMNYLFPSLVSNFATEVFFLEIMTYAFLELIEYFLKREHHEPLFLFAISVLAALACLFLKSYEPNLVLALTISGWLVLVIITKIISLKEIYIKYTHLFLVRLSIISVLTLIGILVSINIYYRISDICYMLGFLYITFGIMEFIGDFMSYLCSNIKFLRE